MHKRAYDDERQYGYSGHSENGLAHELGPGYSDSLLKGSEQLVHLKKVVFSEK
ncbi:hypothetical protein [Candidatus Nitrospira allomarina]|uniref:Uncharacterized protein n=1 Tax=Candidatus Nitrospira allomarina TaxID=3020900 RepID=A0AA96JRC3_9BACT|nr:hypothetical protein [Candidatus Nitrospira allomarina]WNM56953.1 hypothetical protein PP769_13325 [Candidatus Nitrospira allomarina]